MVRRTDPPWGHALKVLRIIRWWSQHDLAAAVGVKTPGRAGRASTCSHQAFSERAIFMQNSAMLDSLRQMAMAIPARRFLEEEQLADTDQALGAVIESYSGLPEPQDRSLMRQSLGRAEAGLLRVFAIRAATFAVRREDSKLVEQGLLALLMAADTEDLRDLLRIVSLHFDASERLGLDTRALFGRVARAGEGPLAEHVARFPDRKEADRRIEAMAYRAIGSGGDFRYTNTS